MSDSASHTTTPDVPKSGHATRDYRVYRVEKGGTDSLGDAEVLFLEGTVEADDPDAAIRQLAAEKRPSDGTVWRAYTKRYETERTLRKEVEERWVLD